MPSPSRKRVDPQPAQAKARFAPAILCCLALAIITALLFSPVRDHAFINYDDPDYVTANPAVQAGLSWPGVKWAFTSSHAYNWHPITWISHLLDVQFFGMNAGAHHLVSVTIHALNACLLFFLLWRMTTSLWPTAIIAAIFAWHPLHVESVAWACERKDVLSTFFWLVTTWFYFRFVQESPGTRRNSFYLAALLAFAAGLMSKPMLVTLPFTLLLLDWWPLSRFVGKSAWRLFIEKVPFFLLTIASSVITFLVQQKEGAVVKFEHLSVSARLVNAAVSYVRYLGKTIWPTDLTIYYQPTPWADWQVIAAAAVLLLGCIGATLLRRKEPSVFVGWFWFIGTLVPVIGIVQVGAQAIADRYMYVPLIGLSVAVVWPAARHLQRHAKAQRCGAGLAFAALAALAVISWKQIPLWKNSETVFSHALAIHPQNTVARVMLANAYLEQDRFAEAEREFRQVLEANTNFPEIHYNLGNLYVHQGRAAEAIAQYEAALKLNPSYPEVHANLAVAFGMEKRFEDAVAHYYQALQLQPGQPDLLRNLAMDLLTLQRFDEAVARLQEALTLDPFDATASLLLGQAHAALGAQAEAARWYTRALQLKPGWEEAQSRLTALQNSGLR